MEKLKRTFRLSEQAVEAIENRNRKLYPTATDFLEAKILAPADNSTEMLHKISAQLREMEASGLLTRTVYAEVPPRVEYALTELGSSLKPVLDAMQAWGSDYQAKH